ncbi:proton channel OtopLc-like isoform X2 [Branchiostoma lanceolatum]|uniref:proton channel OtopLc-like isoform X2 n=1 Tax=Branchiostoma lanceolatum TaxID=7740 RepID=UPI00345328C5
MSDDSEQKLLVTSDRDNETNPKDASASSNNESTDSESHTTGSDIHANADGCCLCPLAKSWFHHLFSRESADSERLDPVGDEHGEHPMQNYLARFVSIICLFCLVTTGIVLSIGKNIGDAMNHHVDFTRTPNITPSPTGNPQMEPIGPEELERFLYIVMIAGLLFLFVAVFHSNVLIVQTTDNQRGLSGQLDYSVLHLLVATVIFAIGALFLPAINIIAYSTNECYRDEVWGNGKSAWLVYQICHFLFIFLQLIFFFKYAKHGVQLKFCGGLSHIVLMLLMGTNVCLWFHILVEESGDEGSLISPPKYGIHTRPSNITCLTSSGLQSLVPKLRPYFHPFTLEYSLISAGLFLTLWNRIGKTQGHEGEHGTREQQTDNPPQQTTCDYMPMVFGGSLGLVVFVVLIAIIIHNQTKLTELGIKTDICNNTVVENVKSELDTTFGMYYGCNITVSVIMLFGCLIVLGSQLKQIMQGVECANDTDPQHKNHIWIDTTLLISSAAGFFILNGFGIAAAEGLTRSNVCGTISHWYMADCVLGTVQCIAQMALILGGLHQQLAGTKCHTFVFSSLVFLNLGLWGSDVYEVQNITTTALGQVYFGSGVWSVVVHIAYPLCIFFRFHSVVTLFPLMKKSCMITNVPVV